MDCDHLLAAMRKCDKSITTMITTEWKGNKICERNTPKRVGTYAKEHDYPEILREMENIIIRINDSMECY